MKIHKTAKALGWFSIALGVTEIVAAKRLGRLLQMEGRTRLMRSFGFREIATGIGILSQRKRAPWLWARVGGDILDLVTLAYIVRKGGATRKQPAFAAAAVAGITALDFVCGQRLSRSQG